MNGREKQVSLSSSQQRGTALLLIFFILFAGVGGWLIQGSVPSHPAEGEYFFGLADAKQALVAYAVTYGDNYGPKGAGPGHFPCPDTDNDGSPNPPCAAGLIARLPRWTKVGKRIFEIASVGAIEDQRIWYSVSDAYRNNPAGVANSETPGELRVDGHGDVVAVLIAPGPPLPGQKRPSNNLFDYLEGENADGDREFSTREGNDRVIAIYRDEFMPAVERRVAGYMRDVIGEYRRACGVYPWAAPYGKPLVADRFDAEPSLLEGFFPADQALPADWGSGCAAKVAPPSWLSANRWPALSYYAIASPQTQAGGPCGDASKCIAVIAFAESRREQIIVALAGPPLSGQRRVPSSGLKDYFEAENSSPGDNTYRSDALSAFNDTLLGMR